MAEGSLPELEANALLAGLLRQGDWFHGPAEEPTPSDLCFVCRDNQNGFRRTEIPFDILLAGKSTPPGLWDAPAVTYLGTRLRAIGGVRVRRSARLAPYFEWQRPPIGVVEQDYSRALMDLRLCQECYSSLSESVAQWFTRERERGLRSALGGK